MNNVTKAQVTLTIPGQIINVDNNKVTVEFPCIDGPILTPEAQRVFTDGMPKLEADLLIERIGHFAFVESLRANIVMSGATQITRHNGKQDLVAEPARKY